MTPLERAEQLVRATAKEWTLMNYQEVRSLARQLRDQLRGEADFPNPHRPGHTQGKSPDQLYKPESYSDFWRKG